MGRVHHKKTKEKNVGSTTAPLNSVARDERFSKNKRLTALIGKYLDKVGYGTIAVMIMSLIFFCGLFFWLFGFTNQSLSFLGGQYFSVVTFTSIGYGDISPIGVESLLLALRCLWGLSLWQLVWENLPRSVNQHY